MFNFIGVVTLFLWGIMGAVTDPVDVADSNDGKNAQVVMAGAQVVNSDFNDWFHDGKVWYPDLNLTPQYYFWDSGNKGTDSFGTHNLTEPETQIVVSGKAAKLTSSSIFGIFAAASIYTGKFLDREGMGANISFGIPFTDRPTSFNGYYYYQPGTIDHADDSHEYLKGQTDQCTIYAILTDWNQPFVANTREGKFINIAGDPAIIAVAEVSSSNTDSGYVPFNLKFNYRNSRTPKYIVIVASASKWGNFFTGSTESVLYVDQFSLGYE